MKTLGQIMKERNESRERQDLSLNSSPQTSLSRAGDFTKFMTSLNPVRQLEICASTDDCIFGGYPTLAEVKRDYGSNAATAWLIPQLFDLSEFCGCKGKITDDQMRQVATIIANTYYYLKVSELMLFFYRFKSGRYGKFYGAVDPLVITTSLRTFILERNDEIARHDAEEQRRRDEADRRNPRNMTLEEWKEKMRQQGIKTNL